VKRSSKLILSQLNILIFVMLAWSLDFIYRLFKLGLSETMQKHIQILGMPLGYVEPFHLLVVPCFLLALYFIKIKHNDAWKISVVQLISVFLITFFFTDPEKNINNIFRPYFPIMTEKVYTALWIIIFPLSTIVVNYILVRLPFLRKR